MVGCDYFGSDVMTAIGETCSHDYQRYLRRSQRKTRSAAKKSNETKRMKYWWGVRNITKYLLHVDSVATKLRKQILKNLQNHKVNRV